MNKKLSVQVGIMTSLFLAAVLIAVEIVMFTGMQQVYLRAKNDMIERDLNVMNDSLLETTAIYGFLEYWLDNTDKMREGLTDDEISYVMDLWQNDTGGTDEWYSSEKNDDYLGSLDPVYLHQLADDYYVYIARSIQYQLTKFGYDRVCIIDAGKGSDGTLLISVGSNDSTDDVAERERLCPEQLFDICGTDAAMAVCSGEPGSIAYEVLNDENGTPYYAGYILIASGEKHRFELCVLYDWSGFRQRLDSSILPSIIISALLVIIANVLLIRFLYLRAVRPVAEIQKSVRGYTEERNTEHIKEELSRITANNEFGALAGDVSRLAEEIERYTAESSRISAELDLASKIQLSALPSKFPAFPDRNEFGIFASMTPAKEVGGDFYDFFLIGDDKLALVIADVSGKGVPAALFMMASKILIDNYSLYGSSPAKIISAVNDRISMNNEDNMFVTVWLGILEIGTGKLTCCNAGHEYPAIKKADGKFELIKYRHDTVVGAMPGMRYNDREIQLDPGDTIFLYTDGVPEATDAHENMYGTERMTDALNSADDALPEELLRTVKEDVDRFVGSAPQFDDLTMLALRYNGNQPGK